MGLRRRHHARGQVNGPISSALPSGVISNPFPTGSIAAPTTTEALNSVVGATALTTVESFSTSTYMSGTATMLAIYSAPVIITNSAQLASLSAAGVLTTHVPSHSVGTATATTSGSAAASTETASTSSKQSSSKSNTMIPAIVVPIIVVLLAASFAAFWFYMRRRHHQEMEKAAKFEKARPTKKLSNSSDGSSRVGLVVRSGSDKEKLAPPAAVKSLSDGQAHARPVRPQRPLDHELPPGLIGVARTTSTSEASPPPSIYPKDSGRPRGGPPRSGPPSAAPQRPPRSAHDMRSGPTLDPRVNPQGQGRSGRLPVLSGGDIIDSYTTLDPRGQPNRPSTAPYQSKALPTPGNVYPLPTPGSRRPRAPSNPQTSALSRNMDNFSPPPQPPYMIRNNNASPASNASSPLLPPISTALEPALPSPSLYNESFKTGSPVISSSNNFSRTQPRATPEAQSPHGLTEENLRIARFMNGGGASSRAGTNDNHSVSDVDEHDAADRKSDVSSLDEEQEHMASGAASVRSTPTIWPGQYSAMR